MGDTPSPTLWRALTAAATGGNGGRHVEDPADPRSRAGGLRTDLPGLFSFRLKVLRARATRRARQDPVPPRGCAAERVSRSRAPVRKTGDEGAPWRGRGHSRTECIQRCSRSPQPGRALSVPHSCSALAPMVLSLHGTRGGNHDEQASTPSRRSGTTEARPVPATPGGDPPRRGTDHAERPRGRAEGPGRASADAESASSSSIRGRSSGNTSRPFSTSTGSGSSWSRWAPITREQLEDALWRQLVTGRRLAEVLLKLRYIGEDQLRQRPRAALRDRARRPGRHGPGSRARAGDPEGLRLAASAGAGQPRATSSRSPWTIPVTAGSSRTCDAPPAAGSKSSRPRPPRWTRPHPTLPRRGHRGERRRGGSPTRRDPADHGRGGGDLSADPPRSTVVPRAPPGSPSRVSSARQPWTCASSATPSSRTSSPPSVTVALPATSSGSWPVE